MARASKGPELTAVEEPTVKLARRRFARRRWARRWGVWRRVIGALLALAGVAGLVWLVFFSSLLEVSGVQVEGISFLHRTDVRRVAAVPVGEPLATVDLDAITARVETLPAVESVDVSRAWPGQIRIAVTERDPVAVVVRGGVVRGLDENGVLFRRYASRPARLPVLNMGPGTRNAALAEAAKVAGALPPGLASKVDRVDVQTIDTITLRLHDGRTIRWGSADDSQDKARVIAVLLRHKGSSYDVSVPGRPTIR
jgi:cell division protein FtsQ